MNWWGKILGGTFGLMVGGPLGALLGAALGHNLDRSVEQAPSLRGSFRSRSERVKTAFFTTTFSVMGHVCKSDGRVTDREIDWARTVMDRMDLDERQRQTARRLFNRGKAPGFPLAEVLAQFIAETGGQRSLSRMLLEIQLAAACADGDLRPVERSLLEEVAARVGLSPVEFQQIEAMVRASTGHASGRVAPSAARMSLERARAILNITSQSTEPEIKRSYRRLMSQHHPDKLVAKGLPDEMIRLATERTREIRAAYDLVLAATRD